MPGERGRRVRGPRYGRGKRWLARWVEPGGREKSKAFTTKDGAEAWLSSVAVDVLSGRYVSPSSVTVAEYVKTWLARQSHMRASTKKQAESRLRLHVVPAIGHLQLAQVKRGQLQDLIATSGLAPATVHVLHSYLAAVFASAVEDRLITSSPCRRIPLPDIPVRSLDPLTPDEVAAIAEGVPEWLAAMVWLGAGTGLRPGELRSLTADRLAGSVLRVDRQLTRATRRHSLVWGPLKTPASVRRVALAPSTMVVIEKHLAGHELGPQGLIFTSRTGGPLQANHLSWAWRQSGARGRGWHELRHHHASLLIAAGLSPRAVADRLGHADVSETLQTYASLWPSDPVRILAATEAALGGLSRR